MAQLVDEYTGQKRGRSKVVCKISHEKPIFKPWSVLDSYE